MEKEVKKVNTRKLTGVVISDKADKTVVVRVDRTKMHPKYNKRFITSKKFQVHDEQNQYKVGDEVVIVATRPISKTKKWRVLTKKEKKG